MIKFKIGESTNENDIGGGAIFFRIEINGNCTENAQSKLFNFNFLEFGYCSFIGNTIGRGDGVDVNIFFDFSKSSCASGNANTLIRNVLLPLINNSMSFYFCSRSSDVKDKYSLNLLFDGYEDQINVNNSQLSFTYFPIVGGTSQQEYVVEFTNSPVFGDCINKNSPCGKISCFIFFIFSLFVYYLFLEWRYFWLILYLK
jgi:hypothetical protein